ncbi:MAG: Na+/H+ antiporter NhaA [Planctomycetota bacterium]|nr:Na+/H+ antiporter NhaA [Planctomycetota bacterium]
MDTQQRAGPWFIPPSIGTIWAAIADDLGAVLVIAVFYTEDIRMSAIGVAAVTLGLLVVANLLGIRRTVVYVVLGTALWVAVLKSGVHATIAGVCLAMTIPARVRIDADDYAATVGAALEEFKAALPKDEPQSFNRRQAAVHAIAKACQYGETPLLRMEHGLVRWVAFFIVPVFAFANAGVDLQASLGAALTTGAGLGIILGLVVGKCLGITLFTWLAVRLGIGALPAGVTWPNIIGVSLIAGIGFTMSIFIAGLAFGEGDALDVVKAAILIGSFVAGILGFTVLRITTSPRS